MRSYSQFFKQGKPVAVGGAAIVYHCAPVATTGAILGGLCAKVTEHQGDPLLLAAAQTEF